MKNIKNGHFHHTLVSALSCVLMMAVAGGRGGGGVLVSICSLDSLVSVAFVVLCWLVVSG